MSIISHIIKLNTGLSLAGSALMKTLLRINGATIGKNVFVSISSRIVAKKLVIGNDSIIKSKVKIKGNKVLIGKSCTISEDCYITGKSDLTIGNTCFIGKKVRINLSEEVVIGNDAGIGENSVIWTHGYFPPADEGFPVTYAPVHIGDGAWVSTNIIILPGVILGKGIIVGAGSVVTKSFDQQIVIAGNPAKMIRNVQDIKVNEPFIQIMRSIFLKYDHFRLVSESATTLNFQFGKKNLMIKEGGLPAEAVRNLQPGYYVIFKHDPDPAPLKNCDVIWFDLDKREYKHCKEKDAKVILDVFQEWGIRLTANYL